MRAEECKNENSSYLSWQPRHTSDAWFGCWVWEDIRIQTSVEWPSIWMFCSHSVCITRLPPWKWVRLHPWSSPNPQRPASAHSLEGGPLKGHSLTLSLPLGYRMMLTVKCFWRNLYDILLESTHPPPWGAKLKKHYWFALKNSFQGSF